ncbi:MAG: phosphatase PAP2 family protein, partial [Streptomyces sp.]|uniref:phosphatase PAP2 family protein n=1 Tax=Streptomyces sp. TaxID=1931 RepID=UPI003D6A5E80
MAEAVWDNPDVGLLYELNGLATAAPTWFDRTMEYVGEYGTVLALVLLVGLGWWRVARRRTTREDAVTGVVGLLWAPLAAAIALLVNIPIRGFVERPRPFVDHKGLEVLVGGKRDFSFVSDHATLAMALAVGIFIVHRRYGLVAIALAVLAGFCRVYMGVHYPTDVIGGLALGTAVALLLAPAAVWLLTPVVRAVAGTPRVGTLVWAGAEGGAGSAQAADGAAAPEEQAQDGPT